MFKLIAKEFLPSVLALLVLTVITGFLYPAIITVAAQAIFPKQANGSMITKGETTVGSELIGQQFSDPKHFWGRLSATDVTGSTTISLAYNPGKSGGSNYGPIQIDLIGGRKSDGTIVTGSVKDRITALQAADPDNKDPVPVDLVTASGSGLDPHISPEAARYQIARVLKARTTTQPDLTREKIEELVARFTEGRQFGILGEPRVNVLKLNLALDEAFGDK
ncbi:MAG TPA: potassium-transporting ATPase subunit KdpC [Planctomycetota bacterium]|nr:potassium-transporting ATPase subunit KdpC [Planctomycetota bacterium]